MLKWIPYVLVRVTFFFICGIQLGIYLPDFISEQTAILLSIVLLISYFVFRFFLKSKTLSFFSGFTGLLLITTLGYVVLLQKTESRKENH
ncbi:MAG TPA: hypothetical protein VIT44_12005, partial [Cyclobacteriaceae bacterium]